MGARAISVCAVSGSIVTRNVLAMVLACVLSVSCRGKDESSPTAPSNPQNTNLSGTWTGTMTRPSDLGSISVRWVITQNQENLTGPISFTYNGVTIDAVMTGSWGPSSGEPMIGGFRFERPNRTSLPNCNLVVVNPGNSPGLEFRGFTPTSRTLTSSTFTIRYDDCQGFVAPDPPSTSRQETSQMTLNKQ